MIAPRVLEPSHMRLRATSTQRILGHRRGTTLTAMPEPSPLPRHLRRSDFPAVGAALCFVLAVAWPSGRNLLLAGATLAGVVWIGADALADDRRGPRARLVMATALLLLAAFPAFLLAADNGLWVGTFPGLTGGLVLWSVGIVSVAAGSRAAALVRLPAALSTASAGRGRLSAVVSSTQRGRRNVAIVATIAFVSLCAFVVKVGGPTAYVKSLNNSAASTAGLTYVMWGISFAKYGSFACLGEAWTHGRRPPGRVIVAVTVAILLLLSLGSRLLLLVALIQLLVLYAAVCPISRRFWLALGTTAVIGTVLFVTLGEFRRWESVPHHPSFPTYLVKVSVPELPRTYANDYADAVRLSVLARRVVPSRAPYEYGKEFLRILLQPIPGQLRPTISTAPALEATFTSGHKNGNALPVPVEGYIEFGFAGTVAFSALLGLFVGLVDRAGAAVRDVGWLLTGVAAGTGSVIVMRGSLHQGIALALVDVIGFLAVHRILYRPQAPGALERSFGDLDTGLRAGSASEPPGPNDYAHAPTA